MQLTAVRCFAAAAFVAPAVIDLNIHLAPPAVIDLNIRLAPA